jgi:sulfopyruvate decarboxylase TPP-binding subunit
MKETESPKQNKTGNEFLQEQELYQTIRSVFGFNFVTGLPCGELRNFISQSSMDKEVRHFPCSNEREAIGVATGAWLAGEKPVVYMQNSGFFLSSNDIGSLLLACRIPIVLVVSWRGAPGETATQHFATGAATEPLLKAFSIPYLTEINEQGIQNLCRQMLKSKNQFVF